MMNETQKKKIYIVHSVKGGSGKTAFSFLKSIKLAIQNRKNDVDDSYIANVLYFDADFKGSATKTLLYGKDRNAFTTMHERVLDDILSERCEDEPPMVGLTFEKTYQQKNINDFLRQEETFVKGLIAKGGVYFGNSAHDMKLYACLDFLFSSPRAEEKRMFSYEMGETAWSLLSVGWYKIKMEQLLAQIISDKQYEHVVIDMPPGDEEYSRELINVLDSFYAKDKIEIYWYSVTTNDDGHLDSEMEDFAQRLSPNAKCKCYNQYVMVYNELSTNDFEETTLNSCIRQLEELVHCQKNVPVSDIKYIKNIFCKDYYDFCRKDRMGLGIKTRDWFYSWKLEDEKEIVTSD